MEFQEHIPPNLDAVADQWRQFFKSFPVTMTKDLVNHVPGSVSIYRMDINFRRETGDLTYYYIGQSGDPSVRANTHKSELMNCKTTTRTGKSPLYDPALYVGIKSIDMVYHVVMSGFTKENAGDAERALASQLKAQYGDFVLTSPRGSKKV